MPSIRNGSFIFTPLPTVLETSKGGQNEGNVKEPNKKKNYGADLKIPGAAIVLDSRFLHTVPVLGPLMGVSSKLWILWELILLGQPLLVLSPSPTLSSDAVFALASIISPLEYKGDFRPFFTIQDSDFALFSDDSVDFYSDGTASDDASSHSSPGKRGSPKEGHVKSSSLSNAFSFLSSSPSRSSSVPKPTAKPNNKWANGLIVGGTNPYFFKALSHWKNIVTLSGTRCQYKFNPYLHPTLVDPDAEIDQGANRSLGLIEYVDQVQAKGYHSVFPPGIEFKKYMKKPSHDDTEEECHAYNEKFIRYHFHLRTTTFLAPLRNFFDRLVASKAGHFKALGRLPLVGELNDSILSSIVKHVSPARSSSEISFYETFIATATFKRWFNKKRSIANDKIAADYVMYLANWRLAHNFDALGEMELVNLYQDATEQIKREGDVLGAKGMAMVRTVMEDIVKRLDADLQAAIRMKELLPQSTTSSK